jgi:hypothetical protein
LRKWFQYPRPVKNKYVPIAAAKTQKNCFPSSRPSLLRHLPGFQVVADSLEGRVVADRGRGFLIGNLRKGNRNLTQSLRMPGKMMRTRRIGLKYCGGCNPKYDRMQAVESIKKRLEEKVDLVSYEDPDAEETLVVTGCPTACVDLKPFEGRPLWIVTNLREVACFIETMNNDHNL